MNRGLIEAEEKGGFTSTNDELPRFMNRGLIEAATAIPPSIASKNFPDS